MKTEYTFHFYDAEARHIGTRTFRTETIEQAYSMADSILKANPKYEDWGCVDEKPV